MTFKAGETVIYSQRELFDTSLTDKVGTVCYKTDEDYLVVDFGGHIGKKEVEACCLQHLERGCTCHGAA